VVDDANILKGGLNVARLVASDPSELISEVMFPNVISVSAGTDQEECALLMEKYNLLTLPVTDSAGRLEGIVRIEDMIYVFQEEATEDMYRMVGVSDEEKILGPFWKSVRGRLPWLCVNLATAGIAAVVITIFQSTLAQVVTLAVFLPVIAGQGGIVGTQTLTLVVRSMALGEISNSNAKQLLAKEFGLGLVHGLILGILAGVVAYMWHGNQYLALVVGLAMLGNLVIAGVSGVVLPLSLRAMKVDPALASAVVVTTVTDVVGFLIYLGLATAAIGVIARSF
jgi:magnesium transporter